MNIYMHTYIQMMIVFVYTQVVGQVRALLLLLSLLSANPLSAHVVARKHDLLALQTLGACLDPLLLSHHIRTTIYLLQVKDTHIPFLSLSLSLSLSFSLFRSFSRSRSLSLSLRPSLSLSPSLACSLSLTLTCSLASRACERCLSRAHARALYSSLPLRLSLSLSLCLSPPLSLSLSCMELFFLRNLTSPPSLVSSCQFSTVQSFQKSAA